MRTAIAAVMRRRPFPKKDQVLENLRKGGEWNRGSRVQEVWNRTLYLSSRSHMLSASC